jgi:hypothetical protein
MSFPFQSPTIFSKFVAKCQISGKPLKLNTN